jgi:hypothetical protein
LAALPFPAFIQNIQSEVPPHKGGFFVFCRNTTERQQNGEQVIPGRIES